MKYAYASRCTLSIIRDSWCCVVVDFYHVLCVVIINPFGSANNSTHIHSSYTNFLIRDYKLLLLWLVAKYNGGIR